MASSNSDYLSKAPLPNTILLGVRVSTYALEREEDKTQPVAKPVIRLYG